MALKSPYKFSIMTHMLNYEMAPFVRAAMRYGRNQSFSVKTSVS